MRRLLLLTLTSLASLGAAESTNASTMTAEKQPPKKMDRFVVTEDSTLSFGLALKVLRYNLTNKVAGIYITDVQDGSDASRQGIRPGTEILALDGKPVAEFEATFKVGGELRRLLVGRKSTDTLVVEVAPLDGSKPRKFALRNHTPLPVEFKGTQGSNGREEHDPLFDTPMYKK